MGQAKLYGQNKGGTSINGIIKDYYAYAGENISAGDLVEYVNGVAGKVDYGESVDTQLSAETYTGYTISAVALDDNRVFIAHSYSANYDLWGIVVTINGAEITLGIDTMISDTIKTGEYISALKLDNGNVFIAHSYSGNYYLYGIICTIDGTTITFGEDTLIVGTTSSYSGKYLSALKLDNGNIFIAHNYGTNYYLRGIVISINGTTITAGSDTALVSSTNAGFAISTCTLPNGNVFIAHSYGSNYYLYGMVVSISGTTITVGSDTVISNSTNNTGYRISAVALDDNRVFISYAHTDGSSYLYGIVCAISGTTITKGAETLIAHEIRVAYTIETIKLDDSRVFIAHSYTNSMYLYGIVCTISDMTITPAVDTCMNNSVIYATNTMKPLMLNNGTILLAHSYSTDYYLYAQIFGIDYENNIPTNNIIVTEYETQVRKGTTAQFDGIAKTSGTGGDDTGHKDIVSIWTMPQSVKGNVFDKIWTKVSDLEYVAEDGTILTGSGIDSTNTPLTNVIDGDISTYTTLSTGYSIHYVEIEFPIAIKILTMKIYLYCINKGITKILGSNNGEDWIELYIGESVKELGSSSGSNQELAKIELTNTDFYKYYRLHHQQSETTSFLNLYEWQTSEYIVLE